MPYLGDLYPRAANQGMRADAWPEGPEAYPGTDPVLAQRQLLDEYGVTYAILNCADLMMVHEVPELAGAWTRAINDHLREEWLDLDQRFVGAISLPIDSPEVAVAEIERLAGDPRWVQVLIPASTEEPMGSRKYRPVFRAAAEAGLPVASHLGGYDPHRGTGWPSYYIEEHVAYALAMESQLLNMVCDGLFTDVPDLKVVLTECGVTWVVALRWALDNAWEQMQGEVPGLDRRPSELIDEHVWFTTQPIEEPEQPEHFLAAIQHGNLLDRLLFSTDYPHWDFDAPTQALPRSLSKELRRKIFAGNACALYDLPPLAGSE
jgi:predicted TIM-barrel fold metal-dependent hydrolase